MIRFAMSSRDGAERRPAGRRHRPLLESLEGRAVPSTIAGDAHLPIAIARQVASHPREIAPGVDLESRSLRGLESSGQDPAQGSSLAPPAFGRFDTYPASSNPSDVVSFTEGDSLYLAVLNHDSRHRGGVTILKNDGRGGFTFVHRYDIFGDPDSLTVGNFTAGPFPDLAVAKERLDNVEVLLGQPGGTFSFAGSYHTGHNPTFVTIANLTDNGSGPADLIVANRGDSGVDCSVRVLMGTNRGTFDAGKRYFAGSGPVSLAVVDLDNGKRELAVTSGRTDYIALLEIDGEGNLQQPTYQYVGYRTGSVAAGSINKNGESGVDLIVGSERDPNELSVFKEEDTGSFDLIQTIRLSSYPGSLTPAYLNGNGTLDLVATLPDRGRVAVLYGKGDGTFADPQLFRAGNHPVAAAVADANGDSVLDLITANQHGGDVGVLLGTGTPIG
jgi:hypothetical protein